MTQQRTAVYALLADGTTVEIRPAGPGDFDAGSSSSRSRCQDPHQPQDPFLGKLR